MRDILKRTTQAAAVVGLAIAPLATLVAQQTTPAPKHHSKVKGALVGGAAGAVVGHPKLGAAAGALHQHHKNKKAGS